MGEREYKVRVPWYCPLSYVQCILPVYEGLHRDVMTGLMKALEEQQGTPQDTVNWTDPNEWIDKRLSGDHAQLARRIWVESRHTANPRYIWGPNYLIKVYGLAVPDANGVYHLTDLGYSFCPEGPGEEGARFHPPMHAYRRACQAARRVGSQQTRPRQASADHDMA